MASFLCSPRLLKRSSRTTALAVLPESLMRINSFRTAIQRRRNLCLYGHPNETWEVTLSAEEVLPELPEPALGIIFARDGMKRTDWLSLVAMALA
ncbi:PHD finger protein ALFIN-LIKE 2-like isoform X2 [Juglans regia]|uniref:PHD finger protein ALFIN-LIKE n=1 Tax=Juglans regia TaxID=51240 RepID=A0A2I4EQY4_JUGRE|nr:PHD finger protein ALFIN-LIKE 2-like isoform X2 [Juglans regia]